MLCAFFAHILRMFLVFSSSLSFVFCRVYFVRLITLFIIWCGLVRRINLSVPQRFASVAERVIAYCREHKIAVSGFLWRAAGRYLGELEGGDRVLAR